MGRKSIITRKIAGIFLSLCMVFFASGLAAAAPEVSDIRGHWAESRISDWMERGLVSGYGDGSFKPDQPVTRAEFVALVNRSFGFTQAGDVTFSDMQAAHWAYNDVAVAVRAGYISGYADGTFGPGREISRQEVAVIVSRLLQAPSGSAGQADFTDRGEIAGWAQDAVDRAFALGLLSGYPEDQSFRPLQSLTRAEAVVILERALAARTIEYDAKGTYGPENGVEHVHQDVVIKAAGVTLRNMVIHGNLTFAESIGEGDAFLNNVTVHGNTFINGGGENSIYITDSVLVSATVDKKTGAIRVVLEGATTVTEVLIHTPAAIDASEAASAVSRVKLSENLPEGSTVTLTGTFENVDVAGSEIKVEIPAGAVENLTAGEISSGLTIQLGEDAKIVSLIIDTIAKVIGDGKVEKVTVSEKVGEAPVIEVEAGEIVYENPAAAPTPTPTPTPVPYIPPSPIQLTGVAVSGQYKAGETLTAEPAPDGATVQYQWQRSDTEDGEFADIEDATESAYQIREEDEGKWIRVRVAGTGRYRGTVTSEARQVEVKEAEEPQEEEPEEEEPQVIDVSAVHVTPETLVLTVGETAALTASVEPVNATNRKVVWSSSDEAVATVDDQGTVTAEAAGVATITAASEDDPSISGTSAVRVISENANVTAQDFGVVNHSDVIGYSVGFRLDHATAADVEQVKVTLYQGTAELASATSGSVLDNYADQSVLSVPFDVLGTFDYGNDEGGNWTYSGWKGYVSDIPDKAEIAVTFKNGEVRTASNANLTGDTSIFDAGTITKTAYWGTPVDVFYYFDFALANGRTIGDLQSLEATAYDGDRRLSTIRLLDESFTNYADAALLGGSFRSDPVKNPSDSWELEAFDGTMPTAIVIEYVTTDGKAYRAGVQNPAWLNEGFKTVVNTTLNAAYGTIQEAIDAAAPGDNTIEIYPGNYGTADIAIRQTEGVNLTLVGKNNVVLKNQIKIDGDGRSGGAESLTIKGFTFDFSDSADASIISAQKGELGSVKNNYAHNITIEDSTFIGNPSAEVVAVKTTTGSVFGLTISNVQGINLHSLGQLHVARDLLVNNATVTGGESGINYYGGGNAVINNLTISGTNYGIRTGQSSGTVNPDASLTITSSSLTAKHPLWLRGDAPASVTLIGTTLIDIEGDGEIRNDVGPEIDIQID